MRPAIDRIRPAAAVLAWVLVCAVGVEAQYVANLERLSPAMRNLEKRPDDLTLLAELSMPVKALSETV